MGVTLICKVGQNPVVRTEVLKPSSSKKSQKILLVSKRMLPLSMIRNYSSWLFRVHVAETERQSFLSSSRAVSRNFHFCCCCHDLMKLNWHPLFRRCGAIMSSSWIIVPMSIIFVISLQIFRFCLLCIQGVSKWITSLTNLIIFVWVTVFEI